MFGTAGQRGDGRGEHVDADDVCLGRTGDERAVCVCLWRVHFCVGVQRTTGVEVADFRLSKDGTLRKAG